MTSDNVKERLEFYVKRLQFDIRAIHKLLDKCDDVQGGSYVMCVVRMDKCLHMLRATMTEIGIQIDYPKHSIKESECPPGVFRLNGEIKHTIAKKVPTITDPFNW